MLHSGSSTPHRHRFRGRNKPFCHAQRATTHSLENASWERVIDVFGLEVDGNRRCKANETWIKSPFTGENTASLHLNLTENIFKDFSSGLGAKVGVLNFCQDLLALRGQAMNCYEVASWMVENGISNLDIRSREVKNHVPELKKPKENKPIQVDLRRFVQPQHPELKHRQVSEATCRYLGCGFLPERPNGNKQSPLNGRLVFQVRGMSGAILTHVGRALTLRARKNEWEILELSVLQKTGNIQPGQTVIRCFSKGSSSAAWLGVGRRFF